MLEITIGLKIVTLCACGLILLFSAALCLVKTDSNVRSGNMDDDEEGRTSSTNFRKENI